jgi:zinc transport system substrate-binding protein
MRIKKRFFFVIAAMVLVCIFTGCSKRSKDGSEHIIRSIVVSDTILSGMIAGLLAQERYSVEAILPPGQCPGHYDVKLTDIEKMKKADLVISFRGMSFMNKAAADSGVQLPVDTGDRNWMAPDSYIYGLEQLADGLSKRFPEDKGEITRRKNQMISEVKAESNLLLQKIKQAGIFGKPVIASSMQKEPLKWMGFRIVGEYGRPEAMSTKEFVRLSRAGKDQHAIIVVDNLQSGPDAGKGIAETLGLPHVVLTNFPSEKGYLATLGENINAVINAAMRK